MIQVRSSWWVTTRWGCAQASTSLTAAAAGWLLSGLTASPLINATLPVLLLLPVLLPLPLAVSAGYGLQWLSLLLLLATALKLVAGVFWVLVAMLLLSMGRQLSRLPLEEHFLQQYPIPRKTLNIGTELGQIAGNFLAGFLFPLGQATLQFLQALILLLPIAPTIRKAQHQTRSAPRPQVSFSGRSLLQGLLFGALFALLPLWVRQVAAGQCLDFGLALTVYGLGRILMTWLPSVPIWMPYIGLASILGLLPSLPGWLAIAGFLPLGILAARADFSLVDRLTGVSESDRWQQFLRFGALGGVLGSLSIGGLAQVLGLTRSLPLLAIAFVLTGLYFSHSLPRSPHPTNPE
ncbi:hypothetical protein [Synechococcus elongatus]|uniref:hypothetical protein n=1 Tax=Synechococcus elongatus TaxID=32046 RepID=UPI000F7DC888|nr:hypothetical protein [Synechococcus elongatus]